MEYHTINTEIKEARLDGRHVDEVTISGSWPESDT